MQGYCMKCKKKVTMKNEHKVKLKKGRHGYKGVCTRCGTKVFKIGG